MVHVSEERLAQSTQFILLPSSYLEDKGTKNCSYPFRKAVRMYVYAENGCQNYYNSRSHNHKSTTGCLNLWWIGMSQIKRGFPTQAFTRRRSNCQKTNATPSHDTTLCQNVISFSISTVSIVIIGLIMNSSESDWLVRQIFSACKVFVCVSLWFPL